MKVAAIANAMYAHDLAKEKLERSEDKLADYQLKDLMRGEEEAYTVVQKGIVERNRQEYEKLLNTDLDKVPVMRPEFAINHKSGKILNFTA